MSRRIRVEHRDGTTDELPFVKSSDEHDIDRMSQASLTTTRSAARAADLEEDDDEVFLEDAGGLVFGGVLRNVDIGDGTTTLLVDSFERYGLDAQPTGPADRWVNVDDATIVQAAIDSIPQIEAGTVETVKSGVSFLFSHATQAKRIRSVADATGARVRYNPEKTVDYLSRIGKDREAVISARNQRVVDNVRVSKKGGGDRANHVRMLGAGEGVHQRTAEITAPKFDPETDREKWQVYSNKEMTDEATLAEQGDELIAELSTQWIEIKATIRNLDASVVLGDTFPVEIPKRGIDDRFAVVNVVRKITEDGVKYETTLSSRILAREREAAKSRKDVQRYNKAVQGTAVPINASGGRQPVNGTHAYQMRLYYPAEVEYEHRLNVRVIGLPYRAYSQGAATAGDEHSHEVEVDHPEHAHDVTIPVPYHTHQLDYQSTATSTTDGHSHTFEKAGHNTELGFVEGTGDPSNTEEEVKTSKTALGSTTTTTSASASSPHTHEPDPGVIEDFDGTTHYPSNCDVLVNGTSQGTAFGDGTGEFQKAVDVRGELTPGRMNTIEVTSESLGHVIVYVEGDVYRQILGGG
jgi:hypothetical protein